MLRVQDLPFFLLSVYFRLSTFTTPTTLLSVVPLHKPQTCVCRDSAVLQGYDEAFFAPGSHWWTPVLKDFLRVNETMFNPSSKFDTNFSVHNNHFFTLVSLF